MKKVMLGGDLPLDVGRVNLGEGYLIDSKTGERVDPEKLTVKLKVKKSKAMEQ